ncbi:MAG: RNA polymerase sigma factor [Candidatus Riflebacteria bacterium]|nr:RNA polymerase sigma factor [Candidatus Riflebacteria bacterium]
MIREVTNGKSEKFEMLMTKYYPLCFYFFHRKWNCDKETSRDLIQEAFFKAFRNIAQLRPGTSFKAWLMTICKNQFIDYQRKDVKRVSSLNVDTVSPGIDREIAKKSAVESALNTLPLRQKEIIEYRYFGEFSCPEIAEMMQIPEGTVKSELFYARKRLMECLEGDGNLE